MALAERQRKQEEAQRERARVAEQARRVAAEEAERQRQQDEALRLAAEERVLAERKRKQEEAQREAERKPMKISDSRFEKGGAIELFVATSVDLGAVGTPWELSGTLETCLLLSFEERLGNEGNGTLPGIA